jgi:NADH-quinone oxidoreductase subunit J
MTTRPRLATDVNYVNGLAALALFAVMAYVFFTAELGRPEAFADGSIVASIGYAMFNMVDQAAIPAESFLVAFIIIALVLDAALDGAVMLSRREDDESVVTALTDGGRRVVGRADGDSGEPDAEGGDD